MMSQRKPDSQRLEDQGATFGRGRQRQQGKNLIIGCVTMLVVLIIVAVLLSLL